MDMETFRIDLPLPAGAMLVEASAGTGKTWSIARLVARLLAEDPPEGGEPPTIEKILVVTFTEAAAAELRDRVRNVLSEAADVLDAARSAGSAAPRPSDPAFAALTRAAPPRGDAPWQPGPSALLEVRSERLRRAVRDFDRASISTIHSFCQRVLTTLAFESEAPFDAGLIKDTDLLLHEIVDDWFSRDAVPLEDAQYTWLTKAAKMTRTRARAIARERVGNRGAVFLPEPTDDWRAAVSERASQAQELLARFEGQEGSELLARMLDGAAQGWLPRTSYKDPEPRWRELLAWLRAGAVETRPDQWRLFSSTFPEEARTKAGVKAGAHFQTALGDALEAFGCFEPSHDSVIHELATYVDAQWRARIEARRALTFDDLLERVARGLARPELVKALRSAYRVALIDEFQDTDAVQWKIFDTVFGKDETARLVLIGDPKQAIYAFRGADVGVYTTACDTVRKDRRFTMRRNFRSDRPLIDALNAALGKRPDVFLNKDIPYVTVEADEPARLHDGPTPVPPFVVRWFDAVRLGVVEPPEEGPGPSNPEQQAAPRLRVSNGDAMTALAPVVARDIRRDLLRGWTITDDSARRAVRASDFAVLVGTNAEAASFRDALVKHGVPAVVARSGSVFESEECVWLERWLRALASDGKDAPARAVAVTPLFGFTVAQLLEARRTDDAEASALWLRFKDMLSDHARILTKSGFTKAFSELLYAVSPPEDERSALDRLAMHSSGERHLTNLRHLAELLDGVAQARRLGAVGLARWLSDRRGRKDEAEAAELRLDDDGEAVKVVTMHKSKGLEYPIVILPGMSDGRIFRGKSLPTQPIRFHATRDELTVDLRGLAAGHAADAHRELMEERQRVMYVALTRAEHRVVVYAGPTSGKPPCPDLEAQDYAQSMLAVLFHGVTPDDRKDVATRPVPDLLKEIREFAPEHVSVEEIEPVGVVADIRLSGERRPDVEPAPWMRDGLDTLWRRESYTGIVGKRKGMSGAIVRHGEEDVVDHDDDTAESEEPAAGPEEGLGGRGTHAPSEEDAPEPMPIPEPEDDVPAGVLDVDFRAFYSGAEAGTWVHAVFEHTSFPTGEPKAGGEFATLVRTRGERAGFPKDTKDHLLLDAFPRMLDTPLGAVVGGRTLRSVTDGDRLDELRFDVSVGDAERHRVKGRALFERLGMARADDPMPPGYLEHVRSLDARPLQGFLTGAIDLVFRAHVGERVQWFVADYKTNVLGPRRDGRLTRSAPGHYAQAWMRTEIARKHYYVQYVLYLVALDRYLRLRMGADYDYDRDVGGALYLFVRGMLGSTTTSVDGRVHGVFHDKPPKAVIHGVSDLLLGDRR